VTKEREPKKAKPPRKPRQAKTVKGQTAPGIANDQPSTSAATLQTGATADIISDQPPDPLTEVSLDHSPPLRDPRAQPNELPRGLKPTRASRVRLEDDVVAQFRDLPIDELRRLAGEHAENARLCAEDRIELDRVYDNYQREMYLVAIKNKLEMEPVLDHLGLATRIKGATNYNNFCQYDPVASKVIFDSKFESI
jgi:hypothetical protein